MAVATVNSDQEKVFSVQDVADEFGKTDGRIRQICRDLGLGTLYGNRVRLLKKQDIERIRKYFEKSGKDFSKDD